ncbi:hypothetical protein ACFPRL_02000 [Pseudoclavibacter helvolus]
MEHDDLTRTGVSADANLRIHVGGLRIAIDHVDDDDAHGVLAGRRVRGRDRSLAPALAGRDDQRQDAAESDGPALFTH